AKKDKVAATLGAELRYLAGVLGLGSMDPEAWFKLRGTGSKLANPVVAAGEEGAVEPGATLTDEDVQKLVDARSAARAAKNFPESDRIRDVLLAAGVLVEDKPGGKATWRRK